MSKKTNSSELDSWLAVMDDVSRADVLKVKIAEDAKTERTRIEQEAKVKQLTLNSAGHHWVRIVWACTVVTALLCATCVGYKKLDPSFEAIQSHK